MAGPQRVVGRKWEVDATLLSTLHRLLSEGAARRVGLVKDALLAQRNPESLAEFMAAYASPLNYWP